MVRIRDDIYPNLTDTLLWQRDEVIRNFLDEATSALGRFFGTQDELIKYINGFVRREDAETFLDVCRFFNIAKNYACHPFLEFIMMISVVENLGVPRYLLFFDWLVTKENKKIVESELNLDKNKSYDSFLALMKKLNEKYLETFGLRRSLLNFFDKNLEDKEKVNLIRSFETKKVKCVYQVLYTVTSRYGSIEEYAKNTGKTIDERLLPACYDWKNCWIQYGQCHPDVRCVLLADKKALEKHLSRTIDIIYDYRSMFVHKARSPPFSKTISIVQDVYENKPIIIHLTLEEWGIMMENALKKHFDKLDRQDPFP